LADNNEINQINKIINDISVLNCEKEFYKTITIDEKPENNAHSYGLLFKTTLKTKTVIFSMLGLMQSA
jgi:hypothetical protein